MYVKYLFALIKAVHTPFGEDSRDGRKKINYLFYRKISAYSMKSRLIKVYLLLFHELGSLSTIKSEVQCANHLDSLFCDQYLVDTTQSMSLLNICDTELRAART